LALDVLEHLVQSLENLEMKKTLVALAALAATSAFAQSTVAITGNIDLGYRSLKQAGVTDVNGGAINEKKTSALLGNGAAGWTSSALGLDVSEDLGGGLKAGYSAAVDLQSFGASTDTPNTLFGNARHSFLSLSDAKMGELRVGYQYTLDDQIQGGVGRATPTGNTGGRIQNFGNIGFMVNPNAAAAAAGTVYREGADIITSGNIVRSNVFQYSSPVMSGFQGLVQWASQGADQTTAGNANEGKADGKVQALALKYSQGPLNLGFSTMKVTSDAATLATANTGTKKSVQKLNNFAANYDFGVAKVFFNRIDRTTDLTGPGFVAAGAASADKFEIFGNGGQIKRKGNDLGVSVPMGKTTLFASTGSGKYITKTDAADTTTESNKVKGRLLGATYDLSKRTSLNAYYSTTKFLTNGSSDLKNTMVGAGLRHQF
jgi:predicted porin